MKTKTDEELQKKIAELQAELRLSKTTIRDLKKGRENYKVKVSILKKDLKDEKQKTKNGIIKQNSIKGHKYKDLIVDLCVSLYVKHGCSLRQASEIMSDFNESLSLSLDSIPSPNTIKNWVLKAGYALYNKGVDELKEIEYSVISDESMMIGSEKLLLTLATNAEKTEEKALTTNDIKVVDISVAPSWSGETISKVFSDIEKKMGKSPSYAISDNASVFNKAIRESGYSHVRDVSHSFALIIKRIYENNEQFENFTKALSSVSFKENMKLTAYLLPPKQRTTARFMNVAPLVEWAVTMHQKLDNLSEVEQKTYGFLKEHEAIIKELSEVFQMYESILPMLKIEGLSKKTQKKSIKLVRPFLKSTYPRVKKIVKEINQFLTEEVKNQSNPKSVYHCSSDIIESLFGVYKNRKSKNKLYGVTNLVLFLPVKTKLNNENKTKLNFKEIMESTSLQEIHQWTKENLTENLAVKRRKVMSAA